MKRCPFTMILINVHYPAGVTGRLGEQMFAIMKIVEMLVAPLNLVLLALLAAVVLLRMGRIAPARMLVQATTAFLVLLAVLPWSDWLVAPLENRIPSPVSMPEHVDGIIVLGGAIDPVLSFARGQAALGDGAERLTAMIQLARRYPSARLIYSGGSGSIAHQDAKEAPVARTLLDSMGFDCSRVVFEAQSRNTRENAVLSYEAAQPGPGQVWLLVTSAAHMPRSLGVFRAVGWQVVPYPVDYGTGEPAGMGRGIANGLGALVQGLHEWGGLLYYRLRGWTDSLYPGL